jgi:tetratricopeptide (TPR) repeat protein
MRYGGHVASRPTRLRIVLAIVMAAAIGCSREAAGRRDGSSRLRQGSGEARQSAEGATAADPPAAPPALQPVALPPMAGVEPALQERIRSQHASLIAARDGGATEVALAPIHGEVGKLLIAAEFMREAEPYLANAATLAPGEMAWPYYLGHALRLRNERERAIEAFGRALALAPSHVPTRVWLGALELDRGDAKAAQTHFTAAVAGDARSAAALSGLGRSELALGDLASARTHLEAALAADPSASTVRYPLAMAYRGLGDQARAEEQLRLWKAGQRSPAETLRDGQLPPADPLMEQIGSMLDTVIAYEVRGTRALDDRRWAEAIDQFRRGLQVAPRDATLHQNLGSALFLAGDEAAAEAEFTEALRLSPADARAHFSMGIIHERRGQDREAIARFADAIRFFPDLVDARFSLADALRRTGRVEEALAHYRTIVEADSSASQAKFGYAIGLVRLGRWQEARAALEDGTRQHPDQPGFAHALARVLAAAPAGAVRDGARAMEIVAALGRQYGASPALVETRAMALAETGKFAEAAATQREAMNALRAQGRADLAQRLTTNLQRYEAGMPCRTPWPDDDPVHLPRTSAPTVRK